MTDNEIIKALECCISKNNSCRDCPYSAFDIDCTERRNNDCIDLINRQQAEIIETRRDLLNEIYALEHQLETTKAEAIKEFAERLKEKAGYVVAERDGQELYETKSYSIKAIKLDNLVKEMVGETE